MYSDIILQTYDTYSLQALKGDLVQGHGGHLNTKAEASESHSCRRRFHLTGLGQKLSTRSPSPRRGHHHDHPTSHR